LLHSSEILTKLRKRSNSSFDVHGTEIKILEDLLPYQRAFVQDFENKYVGFCGGYGCVAGETLINGVPIKELTGTPIMVQTLCGEAVATPAYKKGVAPLYRVLTSLGQEVLVTKAHRFLTPFGWRELSHLQPGDLIAVRGSCREIPGLETAKDLSASGHGDFRSCDELPTPWEAFYQGQSQQFDEPSIFHDLGPLGLPADPCSSRSSHPAGHHDFSDQLLVQGIHEQCLRERQIDERPLSSQSNLSYNRESQLLCSHKAFLFQLPDWLDSVDLTFETPEATAAESLHRPCSSTKCSNRADNPFYTDLSARPLGDPTDPFWMSRHDFVSGFSVQFRSFSESERQFSLDQLQLCASGRSKSFPLLSRSSPAWQLSSLNSHYTWASLENVEYVRTDDFYDIHVPLWNHYEAHGILHHNSGKTHSLVAKQLLLCFRSQGFTHLFLEPTIPLIDDVALPKWNEMLEKYSIPHTFKASPRPSFKLLLPGGETPVLLRSMENYERLIGVNAASIATDETDTTRPETAEKAMIKLQGRVRVGNCPQIAAASTPEGYGWMYTFFEEQKSDNKKLYRGKSEDNPYLDPGFVEDLKTKYHPQLIKAYLNGEFVNLESATVFYEFDRNLHTTGIFLPERNERIVFGADFNIGQCHAVYGVIRPGPGGQQLHCFAESKVSDTFSLVAHLREKYPHHFASRLITCYPDASGSHDSTSSTQSDHEILSSAGIQVIAERRNPPIAETLAHANVHMHRGLVLLNPTTCHNTISSAERWSYDSKTLKPSKGGATDYSHAGDALRYLIWQVFQRAGTRAGHGGRWR
jgi:hypothetical protein